MPRKLIGPEAVLGEARAPLAEELAAELKGGRDYGQPQIYEQTYRTGKARVTVIWDAWDGMALQQRTATILRAYEIAEGPAARDRVALASGLTVAEAYAAGMLPFQVIAAVRASDPVTPEQVRQAMLEEGASELADPRTPQLRFATEEEAEACRQRLMKRLPGSADIWIISREPAAVDYVQAQDWMHAEADA
jgi:hypothetical protein